MTPLPFLGCPPWCATVHRPNQTVVIHQSARSPWVSADGSAYVERMARQYDDGPPLLVLVLSVDGCAALEMEMTATDTRVVVSELCAGLRGLAGPALAG